MDKFNHLSVIRASGIDAASFLQGQLSNDFVLLKTNQWQLAAYCSPKGRMLASFWGIKLSSEDICLVISKDIAAATLKRLSMFVMRAKLTLADATAMLPELFAQHDLAAWSEGEVARGVTRITAPLVDLFVPQMLNYESIGGVSFKKGCYPGQEVVARSQFRGTLKRRAYLAHSDAALSSGQEIFHSLETDQPCGLVAAACAAPDGGCDAIISIQTSAAASGSLHIGAAGGATLSLLPLPYPLLEDI